MTQPAASQHLKVLRTAELIKSDKKGNNIYYYINTQHMIKQKENIDQLFHNIINP
ncbi:ArsR/SmtB family transcription factor [Methanosphaera cuniculi]|uniref:ArsR/SmtB family transcription factor n=1 Tax=Methanosphaera cuniculi TaxID=1077256 RepID=UPI000D6C4A35